MRRGSRHSRRSGLWEAGVVQREKERRSDQTANVDLSIRVRDESSTSEKHAPEDPANLR